MQKIRLFRHFVPDMVDLIILLSDRSRAFWLISQELDMFLKYKICAAI